MTVLEWVLWTILFTIYIVCLFTVCTLTFRKGYLVLGIIGIFLPILWLIGAVLPDRRPQTTGMDSVAATARY